MLVQNQPQPFILINILKVMIENKQQEFYSDLLKQEIEILDELKGKEVLEQRLKLIQELIRTYTKDNVSIEVKSNPIAASVERDSKYGIEKFPLYKDKIKSKAELWYYIVYDSANQCVTVEEGASDAMVKFPGMFNSFELAKTSARNFLSSLYNKGDGVLDVDTIGGKGYTYKIKQEHRRRREKSPLERLDD